jgi:hypothetical protein
MPELSDDPKARAGEEQCLADVATHSLHVLRVLGDAEWPEFSYSVGLYRSFALPEVIILGLRGELAHWILNELAARAREGLRYQAGDMVEGLLAEFPVTFRPVPPEHVKAHFGWARWFYEGEEFPTLQLVFPTTSGIWPWDSAAPASFLAAQPVLETTPLPAWARKPLA